MVPGVLGSLSWERYRMRMLETDMVVSRSPCRMQGLKALAT